MKVCTLRYTSPFSGAIRATLKLLVEFHFEAEKACCHHILEVASGNSAINLFFVTGYQLLYCR